MNYRIVNGSVSYGADIILEEINFEIKNKEKIAIVGRNGSGKSTLLKAIIDNELLSEGIGTEKFNIYREGNPSIGYLKQIDFEDESVSMLDEILKVYKEITTVENKMEELVTKMQENSSEELSKEYSRLQDRYELFDGYTYKKEYETAISKFGFSKEDKFKKISEFSGEQRTKIAFIKLLLSKPDILLLDEPTNHMDIVGKETLENLLKEYTGTIIFVSHDRFFVKKIADSILAFENGDVHFYKYGYDEYLEKSVCLVQEKQKETVKEKEPKKIYNSPLKEKSKLERALRKIEDEINKKESRVSELQQELLEEEIYTDYVKVGEINLEIDNLNKEIEEFLLRWEELQQ